MIIRNSPNTEDIQSKIVDPINNLFISFRITMDEESILKALTKNGDGTLLSLDGLSKCGKI